MDSEDRETQNSSDKEKILPPQDPIFASSPRLAIMMVLLFYRKATFTELQNLLNITSGNLDYHIKKLESEGYLGNRKIFFFSRIITLITITKYGEKSFRDYTFKLRDILNRIE